MPHYVVKFPPQFTPPSEAKYAVIDLDLVPAVVNQGEIQTPDEAIVADYFDSAEAAKAWIEKQKAAP